MRTLLAVFLAATALVAQSSPVVDEPTLAGVLDSFTAAQFLLPVHGFSATQLAFSPVPQPALRAGATTLFAPDPLLCSANYVGADVAQLVFVSPEGSIVLLDASSSLAFHVLAVPAGTWVRLGGVCIDSKQQQVVLLDAAQSSLLRIDFADLRAGNARFKSTALPLVWSGVRGIAFDLARDRIIGLDPVTGDLLQHSATDPTTNAGMLRPLPSVGAFGFAPTLNLSQPSVDLDLFVTSGEQPMLTDQWTWNTVGTDDETGTLIATVDTSVWTPPSPDPSGLAYDALNNRLVITDSEVDEMTIYAGKNVYESSRTGVLARTTTTVGYTVEPAGMTLDSATGTFYIADDDKDQIWVITRGADGLLNTADDVRRSFKVANFCEDAEGLAFDNGTLWIAGGISHLVHRLRPGPNGILDGTSPNGDDLLASFDIAPFGVTDPSGVAVRSGDGGIHVLGIPKTRLLHLNKVGQLVRVINLPATAMIRPQGLVFAPSTVSAGDSLFLVDRGHDNDVDPLENDGKFREYGMPTPAQINMAPVVNAGPDTTTVTTAAAHITGIAEDDGLPSTALTIQWTKLSGPGTVTFSPANQGVTNVSFSATGNYTLQLSAGDSVFTTTDTVVVTVTTPLPGIILERTVAATWDDAEEQPTTVNRSSTDLEMTLDGTLSQVIGIRFLNLTIPTGSTIASAYVQFTTDEVKSVATQLTIAGEANDNPPTFLTNVGNISTRPRTIAQVPWAPVAWTVVGEAGANQRTPQLTTVLQEIVSRPGWVSGNAVVLVITGTGCRAAGSFDHNPGLAPKLVIRYTSPVNQPPVVNAGPDVTSPINVAAHLAGSVVDDGQLNPVTIQWSKISGPGTATFTPSTLATTDATFSVVGTYTLQLSANDGQYTRTDTCVVTVTAAVNQPPVVNAGPDVTTALSSAAHLAGTVTDDGLPGPLTITWSKVSGPGTVTFAPSNAAVTNATFSLVGSYTCKLSASDGALTTTDTVVVTVQSAPVNQAPVVNAGPDVTVTLPSAAHLAGTVTDDGLPGPLTITWSKLSGPGTATFAPANQAVTDATFSLAGSYTCQLSASDGALTTTDTVVVTVQAGAAVTLNLAIISGNDDAEQAGNSMDRGGPSLEMVMNGTTNQLIGLRFQSVTIPAGATITSANLQFTNNTNNSSASALVVAAQAIDNAPGFSNSNNDISNRTRTAATVAWAPAPWTTVGQAGADQRTPNLASVVQQVVSRPGWVSGNALVFIITGTAGTRSATSFNTSAANAPKLIVTYQAGAPVNQAPVVNAGPDVTTALASAAHLAGTVTDDGLPGPLTITWSKLSGPGTASFAPANAAVTNVTFSLAGSYTCQLSASDGALTTTDTVVVTVQSAPVNQAPVVNAGPDVTVTLPSAAHLAGTVTDDGLPGPLTITWSKLSGPGTASFAPANQAVTDATFSLAGSYTCQLSASDGALTTTDTVVVTVQASGGGGTTVERSIAISDDDAEEGTTSVNRSSGDLELVTDGAVVQTVGLRFQNVTLPPGATITSAYVQFTTDTVTSAATQLTIAGEAADNPTTFVGTAGNISTRPRTTATAAWAPVAWNLVNEAGLGQRTPSLVSVVQEIKSRSGWVSGNAMVFVITGTGLRTARSFDNSPTLSPKLVITYQ